MRNTHFFTEQTARTGAAAHARSKQSPPLPQTRGGKKHLPRAGLQPAARAGRPAPSLQQVRPPNQATSRTLPCRRGRMLGCETQIGAAGYLALQSAVLPCSPVRLGRLALARPPHPRRASAPYHGVGAVGRNPSRAPHAQGDAIHAQHLVRLPAPCTMAGDTRGIHGAGHMPRPAWPREQGAPPTTANACMATLAAYAITVPSGIMQRERRRALRQWRHVCSEQGNGTHTSQPATVPGRRRSPRLAIRRHC